MWMPNSACLGTSIFRFWELFRVSEKGSGNYHKDSNGDSDADDDDGDDDDDGVGPSACWCSC